MVLGDRTDLGSSRFCGCEAPSPRPAGPGAAGAPDAELAAALRAGFDFAALPLLRPPPGAPGARGATPWPDTLLEAAQWGSQVVGLLAAESAEPAEAAEAWDLEAQLGWAQHVGVQAVVLPGRLGPAEAEANGAEAMAMAEANGAAAPAVRPDAAARFYADLARVAGAVAGTLHQPHNRLQVWVRAPLALSAGGADSFEQWQTLRALCDHHNLLKVYLELPAGRLGPGEAAALERWLGEPVQAASLPAGAFVTNERHDWVLPKRHQEALRRTMAHGIQLVLTGAGAPGEGAGPEGVHPLAAQLLFVQRLFRGIPEASAQEEVEREYCDYLQAPLQPLQDHLESSTYETFERDATKYTTYMEAVRRALLDRHVEGAGPQVVMVVGAGRGPLVRSSIMASMACMVPIRVYAVEKNPNAVVTIRHLVATEGWGDIVTVVHRDMREWKAPEPADILVSELLGSFGDNELSPECLDGAQRFLKPGGVSIPQAYTSFLAPVATHKLHNDVRAYKDRAHLETSYVVKFHRHHLLAPNQPVFTFTHPSDAPAGVTDGRNARYKELVFERPAGSPPACMHGFIGYFEAALYADVLLSTRPESHTPGMFSWFPIYFPLIRPLPLARGAGRIAVQMWRKCTPAKVWYEWSLTAPEVLPIHNVNGRSYAAEL